MKTHDLAKALNQLAKALGDGPNIELSDLGSALSYSGRADSSGKIALNLSTLAELSRIDRRNWLSLISDYGFPIHTRPRDASRDILGKLLRYLEDNPGAREQLKNTAAKQAGRASPELMRALQILLRDVKGY